MPLKKVSSSFRKQDSFAAAVGVEECTSVWHIHVQFIPRDMHAVLLYFIVLWLWYMGCLPDAWNAPGMPGMFSPPPRVSDPDMHHHKAIIFFGAVWLTMWQLQITSHCHWTNSEEHLQNILLHVGAYITTIQSAGPLSNIQAKSYQQRKITMCRKVRWNISIFVLSQAIRLMKATWRSLWSTPISRGCVAKTYMKIHTTWTRFSIY